MHLVEYTDNQDEWDKSINYKISKLVGIRTTRCLKANVPQTIKSVIESYSSQKVKFIYGGGKSIEGFYAYFEAVREVFDKCVEIDYLFIACGTGTTLTGVCAGMQRFYPEAKVYAISVARSRTDEMLVLQDNMEQLNEYLDSNYDFSNLVFVDEFVGEGYGKYNDDIVSIIRDCASKEGILLDPTYSGKAFYGMNRIIRKDERFKNKNILFWNTGGIFNLLSEINLW